MSTIFGTSARDSIVGSVDDDTIWAYQGGRDTIQTLEGDDFISLDGELNENDLDYKLKALRQQAGTVSARSELETLKAARAQQQAQVKKTM